MLQANLGRKLSVVLNSLFEYLLMYHHNFTVQ